MKQKSCFARACLKLEKVYILKEGTAQRFYEDFNEKIVTCALHNGEVFGGISILLNESGVIRSLEIQENTSFYTFPKNLFIYLCDKHEDFKYHFTNMFGKRMLDKSNLNQIAKTRRGKEASIQFFSNSISGVIRRNVLFCGGQTIQ